MPDTTIDTELEELLDEELPEPAEDGTDETAVEEDKPDFRVRWRGDVIEININEFSGQDFMLFRQAVGQPLPEAVRGGGLDAVAGLLWRVLRRRDSQMKFQTVARELRLPDLLDDDQDT